MEEKRLYQSDGTLEWIEWYPVEWWEEPDYIKELMDGNC